MYDRKTDYDMADFIIDGTQATKLNGMCTELNNLKEQIAPLDKAKKLVTNDIKELLKGSEEQINAGTYVTSKYSVLITVSPKKLTVDLEKLQELEPTLFETLVSKYPKVTNEIVTLKKVDKRK